MSRIIHVLQKYNSLSITVKASLWFAICSVLQKGIAFITTPIFTRLLTTEQFGQYSVFMTWQSLVAVFATLKLYYGVFNKGMIKYEKDKDGFTSALQGLVSILVFVCMFLTILFHNQVEKLTGMNILLIFALFIGVLFSSTMSFWLARERYDYKYKVAIIVTLLFSLLTPIIGVLAVVFSTDKGIARILSLVIVQSLFGIILYYKIAKKGKKFYDKKYWKYAFFFNLPLIPHYLSQTVLNQSDRIMIDNISGTEYVGIYTVAFSLSQVMNIATESINSSFVPWQYRKLKENTNESLSSIGKISNVLMMLLAVFICIFITITPELMRIIAAPNYFEAIWIVPPLALTVFYSFLYTLFANIEFYFEERGFVLIASVSGAALNVILNYIAIPVWGYQAAAYTTLICFALYSLSHYFFMIITLRKNGLKNIYSLKWILSISFVLLLYAFIMIKVFDNLLVRIIIVVIIIASLLIFRKKIKSTFLTINSK